MLGDCFVGLVTRDGFRRLALGTLGFNLFVIVWGAWVRASGSGAGCGAHWPLCNGEVVPRAPALATLIEFGHRLTSGVALLLVAMLLWVSRRLYAPGDPARSGAHVSAFFLITEALIGAGLVLLEYVANDRSIARGWWVSGHLVNTFLLVAALTATWAFAAGAAAPRPRDVAREDGPLVVSLVLLLILLLVLGVSGAITALGDTLFPVAADGRFLHLPDATAHAFVQLRVWHPMLALAVGVAVVLAASAASRARPEARVLAGGLVALYAVQLVIGLANVWLLAPIWLQLVHLLAADSIWIVAVLLAIRALGGPAGAGSRAVHV